MNDGHVCICMFEYDVKCDCVCVCVLVINFWVTSCMNEFIPDLDRRHVASSQCSYTAGGTIRPCATHKDDTVIMCGHNSVDMGAPPVYNHASTKKDIVPPLW